MGTYYRNQDGLRLLIEKERNFPKYMEKNYRINQYDENGDLHMTSNERFFHLIGFIDALSLMVRNQWVSTEDLSELSHFTPEKLNINKELKSPYYKDMLNDMSKSEVIEEIMSDFAKIQNKRMLRSSEAQCAMKIYTWIETREWY